MDPVLTPAAAKELGRAYRFVRQARGMTVRGAEQASGVSYQYVADIESGARPSVREHHLRQLAQGYLVPTAIVDNLLFKARIMSALERRGLDAAQQAVAWKRVESTLMEFGVDVQEGVRDLVATLYR